MSKAPTQWWRDFDAFLKVDGTIPPVSVSRVVLAKIKLDLRPSFFQVFGKLAAVHLVTGSLTLLVCPQLGVGPDWALDWLSPVFMQRGPIVCAAVCGSIFLSFSVLLGALFLRPEELRLARQLAGAQTPLLALGSLLGILLLGGHQEDSAVYFAWFAGAAIPAFFILQGVSFARFRLRRVLLH